ncbi:methyltransferase, partial [Paracoccus sp. PXZ]
EAGRVIVSARKGARAPLRLLFPFVMHAKPSHSADQEDLTEAAQAVLRGGAALSLGGPNFR